MRSSDFRRVYDQGRKVTNPYFTAFCLREAAEGPRIGFTTPRALGKAVVRNRVKRRVREAARLHLDRLSSPWWIVINPRLRVLDVPFAELEREMDRLFRSCSES